MYFIKKITTIFKFNLLVKLNFVNFQAYFIVIIFMIAINLKGNYQAKLAIIIRFKVIIKFKKDFIEPGSRILYNFNYYSILHFPYFNQLFIVIIKVIKGHYKANFD